MEPWFRWSWLLGIKPVHSSGWAETGIFFLVAVPLMFGSLGAFGEHLVITAFCSMAFVASVVAFFWLVFWKLDDGSD